MIALRVRCSISIGDVVPNKRGGGAVWGGGYPEQKDHEREERETRKRKKASKPHALR